MKHIAHIEHIECLKPAFYVFYVEYELKAFGKTMLPMLESIAAWGRETGVALGSLMNRAEAETFVKWGHS